MAGWKVIRCKGEEMKNYSRRRKCWSRQCIIIASWWCTLMQHWDAGVLLAAGHQKIHIHIVARVFESYACHTVYHFTVMHWCDALWCTVNRLQWNGMVGASCPSQVIAWPPTWGMVRPGNSHHSCHRRSICHQLMLLPLPLQVNKTKQITKVLNRLLTSHFQFL